MLKAQYPEGDIEKVNAGTKPLFEEMISYIVDKSGFDIHNKKHWEYTKWSHTRDFIVNVIKNNIDKDFVAPNFD